jgi:serine/threonine protein kinase
MYQGLRPPTLAPAQARPAWQAFRVTIARIGRFGVERVLGTGTFATVWLARDEDLDAWVAIKLLADNWSLNEDARRRFIEEARALRRLDDDRIVRVYEIGRLPDDRPYIVMEYADRGTMEDRMRLRDELDQPFSVREAVELGVEIAECLIAVHGSRMVHRDVKPSNVLFRSLSLERQDAMRRNGQRVVVERTLLGDFGIARRLEGVLGHTTVVGSPRYMAPEQADPRRAFNADYRSDIYSAAVIVRELLTGRDDAPSGLERAIERGLSPNPDTRFESAWEWRDALRAALMQAPPVRSDTAPIVLPASPSAATPTRRGASTLPAATRAGTKVLERASSVARSAAPSPPAVPARMPNRSVRTVDVRLSAAAIVVCAVAMFVGALLPWSARNLGVSFPESALAIAGAAVAFLAAVRMWRTRRRWVAAASSAIAGTTGLASAALGLYEIFRIGGRDAQSVESGPVILLVAGLVAFAAGTRALKRLRFETRMALPSG